MRSSSRDSNGDRTALIQRLRLDSCPAKGQNETQRADGFFDHAGRLHQHSGSHRRSAVMSNANAATVDVAVVQAGSVPFDAEACVGKAVHLIEEAAATGAKVVVF